VRKVHQWFEVVSHLKLPVHRHVGLPFSSSFVRSAHLFIAVAKYELKRVILIFGPCNVPKVGMHRHVQSPVPVIVIGLALNVNPILRTPLEAVFSNTTLEGGTGNVPFCVLAVGGYPETEGFGTTRVTICAAASQISSKGGVTAEVVDTASVIETTAACAGTCF